MSAVRRNFRSGPVKLSYSHIIHNRGTDQRIGLDEIELDLDWNLLRDEKGPSDRYFDMLTHATRENLPHTATIRCCAMFQFGDLLRLFAALITAEQMEDLPPSS